MTLALLITAATGAWADGDTKYTVTFKANGKTKTVENVTLPHTFTSVNNQGNGELDLIINDLYNQSEGWCVEIPTVSGNSNVTAGLEDGSYNQYITISAPFEGNATVSGSHFYDNPISSFTYTLEISIPGYIDGPAVTINDDKTEASFLMPTSDVTVNYELVRDITQKVDVETRIDGTATERVRIAKDGDGHYKFVTKQGWQFAAVDKLDNNKDLPNGELTYTFKMKEDNDYVAKNFGTDLCPGTWRLEAEANADKPYDGIAYGPDILLYDFKNISFAKGYTTHYYSESLVLDEVQTGLHFYAVTAVTSEKVTLTEIEGKAIPGGTPFIVYNETAEPITAVMGMLQADDVTSAAEFKGTAEDKKMDAQSGCYILRNGDSTPTFRLVKGAGTLPAHRCYIELGAAAGTRSLGFDFGDGTTRIEELKNGRIEEGEYYDLQGRKHQGTPQRKGVYVKDGRKVIVR